MKTHEITLVICREINSRASKISSLHEKLKEVNQNNKVMEKKINASGSLAVLETVKFQSLSASDFVMVMQYALSYVRHFVKYFIREMESANWDVEAAVNAIQSAIKFSKSDHKAFVFESFVCREIFSGFNDPIFGIDKIDQFSSGEKQRQRVFFFEEFKKLRSASVNHFEKHKADY